MQRRDVLRASGAAVATVLTTGLPGCSDSGDNNAAGDDTDDGDGSPSPSTPAPTPTPSAPVGEVVENSVSGLEIVDWTTAPGTQDDLQVTLTVENVGDQRTNAFNYTYDSTAYDSAGEDITTGVAAGSTGSTIDPGETTTITMYIGAFGGPSEIARFELTLRCDGAFDDGVYCTS